MGGECHLLKLLLDHGTNPSSGELLIEAIRMADISLVHMLLTRGANLNKSCYVKMLKGPEANQQYVYQKHTPLWFVDSMINLAADSPEWRQEYDNIKDALVAAGARKKKIAPLRRGNAEHWQVVTARSLPRGFPPSCGAVNLRAR